MAGATIAILISLARIIQKGRRRALKAVGRGDQGRRSDATNPVASSLPDEALLDAIRAALSAAKQPVHAAERLPLPTVLSELNVWLADERQWHAAYAANWKSLINDVEQSLEGCGSEIQDVLLSPDQNARTELTAVRRRITGSKTAPDASLRRRLQRVCELLTSRLQSSEVLLAALNELRVAAARADPEAAEGAARELIELAVSAGRSREWFPGRVRSLLDDNALEIAAVRGDEMPADPQAKAGTSPAERLDIVRRYLTEPPRRGEVVVWMDYRLAKVGWPPEVKLGDHVALYDDSWLRSCLEHDTLDQLPPEVRNNPHNLRMLVGVFPEQNGSPGGHSESVEVVEALDEPPVAYIRVDLGEVLVAKARTLAVETAEAVVSLASLYGLSPSTWQPGTGWTTYIDGEEGGWSSGASPAPALSVEDWVALEQRDHTASTLAHVANLLGPHLPVRDPGVAEACTLLSWLRQARVASDPARLLLCDRVLEQVSGWAGVADRAYFLDEHMRLGWSYRRVRSELAGVAWDVQHALHDSSPSNDATWLEIYPDAGLLRGRVNLQAFLCHLPSLVAQLPQGSRELRRAQRLLDRTRTGGATIGWLRELDQRFNALEARARRTRNALVHGGPISQETVAAVVDFADELAANALNVSVQGRLAGHDLVDHFLDRRADLLRSRRLLDNNQPSNEALFWDESGGL